MKTYYVNGDYLPASKAMIPVEDLSVLRGYAVCDVMRTHNKKPYLLYDHIKRLILSATGIGLDLPWSESDIVHIILTTLKKNTFNAEVNIRTIITGGSSPDFFYPQGNPRLIVMITDLNPMPAEWYLNGVKVITRQMEKTLPDVKITAYIPAVMALKEAKKQGCIEALYINRKNQVLEGTTSNLFAVINDTLVTPAKGILKGITRQAVLMLARNICPVKEEAIRLEDLLGAQEVFISGTSKGVVPVIQINETIIGNGCPGPNTRKIMAALESHSMQFDNGHLQTSSGL